MAKRIKFTVPAVIILAFLAACGPGTREERVSKTLAGPLDTVSTVTLYDYRGEGPIDEIFAALEDIDRRMSAVSDDSEIAAINRNPTVFSAVSGDTFDIIALSKRMSEATDGAFDITIRPVIDLWGIDTADRRIPADSEINAALSLVGYSAIVTDEESGSVKLENPGMKIDLGSVAKGYACDIAAGILSRSHVRHAVIDLGGNIYTYGFRPDGSPWRIGVKNPLRGENGYFGIVYIADKSAVTSGIYERFFEYGGKTYHHIMNPLTGRPVDNGLLSVTVIDESSATADCLSTACFVMGAEKGIEYLETVSSAEGIFVTADLKVYITSGLPGSFEITDDRFILVTPDETS